MNVYDFTIIGAGPAGMSAALFAQGDGLVFRIVEKGTPCGFVKETINTNFTKLENYLGIYDVDGSQISQMFSDHLKSREIQIEKDEIKAITPVGNEFRIISENDESLSKTVLLATGTRPKKLNLEGLENVRSKVHYQVDESSVRNYIGKDVLVVGGRNSGAVTAVKLRELGCNPIILEKGNIRSAKGKYLDKLRELSIPYHTNSTLERVSGKTNINYAEIKLSGVSQIIYPAAIFPCIGSEPNNSLAVDLGLTLDEQGNIIVDRKMQTSHRGIFAAGDVNGGVKMIAVAVGEGATAEYYANTLIRQK